MNTALKFLAVLLAPATPLLASPVVEKRQGGSAARLIVRNSPAGGWPWPFEGPFLIKPVYGADNKCLEVIVMDGLIANGTPVQIFDCNGTPAQQWEINTGSTKVKLAGKNFCLEAGSTPGNGTGVKIWQCYDNLPAQQWNFTSGSHIALEGSGQCWDLPSGKLANGKLVETWQCSDNNFNQVWSF